MKQLSLLILTLLIQVLVVAQSDTPVRSNSLQQRVRLDSGIQIPTTPVKKDSLFADTDSTVLSKDSTTVDSLQSLVPVMDVQKNDTSTYAKYMVHPYLPLSAKPMFMISDFRETRTLDDLFYLLMGVLLLLAFIRSAFPRYFKNLFVLFFQTSLRQKQTRDQLLQDNLGSVFVNLLFIVSTSIY